MPDALSTISTRKTAQSQRVPGRSDQVKNSAGGYVFKTSDATRLHRFLTLGTEGGTYYSSAPALSNANAAFIIAAAQADATSLVTQVVEISQAGRAPRNNPALFALAVAASVGDDKGRRAALDALPLVARTGTHLFQFISYVEQFRGWGKGLHRALTNWYSAPVSRVEYQALKYRQREGWTHADVLRKIKMRPPTQAHKDLFAFIVGKEADLAELPLVRAFQAAQTATTAPEWIKLIQDNQSLSWEMLPDAARNEPNVWRALVDQGMPQTALMRNLPTLTRLGILEPLAAHTATVAAQLADPELLSKGRVHPVNILVALKTYAQGRSDRSKHTWNPSPKIIDALDAAFYAAYAAVEPANKRTMLALDVSGSMTSAAAGLPITCREVSAALALVTMATEPAHMAVGFTSGGHNSRRYGGMWGRGDAELTPLSISPRQRLDDVVNSISNLPFGGTDCALPMVYATKNNIEIDTFIIYTDSETWYGDIHPFQALKQYRQHSGIDAKLIVTALTPTDFTIADPNDAGSMDISGFDSAVPQLIGDFSAGRV